MHFVIRNILFLKIHFVIDTLFLSETYVINRIYKEALTGYISKIDKFCGNKYFIAMYLSFL